MSEEQAKLDAVLRVYEQNNQGDEPDNIVTLVSGVRLELRGISPFILMSLDNQKEFRKPPVPTVYDEHKGRDIPNFADQDYLDECNRRDQMKGEALIDAIIGLGSKVIHIPEGIEPVESSGWSDALSLIMKLNIPESGPGRTLIWVKYVAITSGLDATRITEVARKQLGVTEEEVQEAIVGFRGDEERPADN